MKKIAAILFFAFMFLISAGGILAKDSDYKNNLLKIDVSKIDEANYDITLYTQKIYTEPVKVVKKSDTIYYLLLPETSNSVTSVKPLDAIKSVLVKSYPYAGQDLENGYTKVAIITSKPLNLTTSLKTLDTSISPRLDPVKLSRLDNVFERYAQRLADNNIQTPLLEFTKTASANRPVLQSTTEVKNTTLASNSFEEYQLQNNLNQTKQKQTTSSNAAQTAAASKPVQTQPAKAAAPATASAPKESVKSTPVNIPSPKAQTAVKQVTPVKQTETAKTKVPDTVKIAQAPGSAPAIKQPAKEAVQAPSKPVPDNAKLPAPPSKNILTANNAPVQTKTPDLKEIEPTPVDVEFSNNDAKNTDKKDEAKEIKSGTKKETSVKSANLLNTLLKDYLPEGADANNLLTCLGIFILLAVCYTFVKKSNIKKAQALAASSNAQSSESALDIKDALKTGAVSKARQRQLDEQSLGSMQAPMQNQDTVPVSESFDNTLAQTSFAADDFETVEPEITVNQDSAKEYLEAETKFEERLASEPDITVNPEEAQQPENDAEDLIIQELYKPIKEEETGEDKEDDFVPYDKIEDEIYSSLDEPAEQDDEATIVSSSKLTETRGLYLARFEGVTSLVGYIQDDIYVLYNFSEDVVETDIQSKLAQENESESLYIVKTGGKKLMVKSSPFDMSLEMVM